MNQLIVKTINGIADMFADLPTNPVLRERISLLKDRLELIDEQFKKLEEETRQLRAENVALKGRIKGCPRCFSLNYRMESCEPHPIMGDSGISQVVYLCPDCGLKKEGVSD
jgi:hypothetical protein